MTQELLPGQLERELTEMFAARAAQLDIEPAAPAVRRRSLQPVLAGATVVAILLATAVVAARLAHDGTGGTSPAGGPSATQVIRTAFALTTTGHWRASTVEHTPQTGTDHPNIAEYDTITFSGWAGYPAIPDAPVTRVVAGRAYLPVFAREVGLPDRISWQLLPATTIARPGQLAYFLTSALNNAMVVGQGGREVIRGWHQTGPSTYAAELKSWPAPEQLTATLAADGSLKTLVARTTVPIPGPAAGRPNGKADDVTTTEFTRLPGHLRELVPPASTVITQAAYQAAFQAFAKSHSGGQQTRTCTTVSPAPTQSDAAAATGVVSCAATVTVVPIEPGKGSPSPSPSGR